MNKKTIITKMLALKGAISNLYGKIEEIQNNQFLSAEGKENELETLKFKYEAWDSGYQVAVQNAVKLFESGALAVSTGKALIDHYKDDRTTLELFRNALGGIFGNGT